MWTVENPGMTAWVQVILGLLLLFFGRKLFWLFVGVFGFLAGVQIAARVAQKSARADPFAHRRGVRNRVRGSGDRAATHRGSRRRVVSGRLPSGAFCDGFGLAGELDVWIAFIAGAVLAAILVSLLFDWALIVLSALTGAIIVSEALVRAWRARAGTFAGAARSASAPRTRAVELDIARRQQR